MPSEIEKLSDIDWSVVEETFVPGSLEEIFEEEPVDLRTFITDSKFLGADWYLSPIQEDAVRHIERVYLPDLYPKMAEGFKSDYWAEPIPMKNLLTLEWGKGSGKDHVCRIASLRVAYMLLCLRSPQRYFGMPEHDSIHMLNIAVNAAQAERAYFKPLTQAVKRGWFADKAIPKRDTIEYAKNLTAISGHSDAESQEGLNLILGIADEIDAFREQSEMIGLGNRKREASTSAESILKMLKGSASTRFPYSYKRVAISYPRYIGSTIQQQTAEAKENIALIGNDKSVYYSSGPYATWEVNPLRKGKSDFQADYDKNPIEAASMYECRPARAVNGYFTNMPAIKQCVDTMVQPVTVEYVLEPFHSAETGETVEVWNAKFHISDSFKPKQGARYAMHADLALTGDRAGLAMSHIERWLDRTETTTDEDTGRVTESLVRVPVLRNDFVVGLEASKQTTPPREIQIRWARELCFQLVKRGFHIVLFSFDQFQSADSMQILNSHGIETDRISADINDNPYKTLRDVAYEGRLSMPYSEKVFDELASLNRIGKKVDHPPGGSKDLSDALACSLVGAISSMGEESVDGKEVTIAAERFAVGPALAPLQGMGSMSLQDMMPAGMKGMSLHG